jgi:all-trans-retinol dehydrogenase (NAD+)
MPLGTVASDPRLTVPLLFAALYYPNRLRRLLPSQLSFLTSKPFIRALSIFVAISTISKVNARLSSWVLNNWKSDAQFVKSQEVVLVTGGSSGIGELVVRRFAGMGVKVVILDVNAPKEPMREFWNDDSGPEDRD